MTDEESLNESSKTCCKNLTWLEIALIVLVSIMALFILGSFGIDFRTELGKDEKQESSQAVCITSECVKTASEVLARIDPSISPCDDFYRFSCGTFAKNEIVQNSDTEISTFTITNDLVENQLRCMLEDDIEEDEAKPFALLKSLYKSCMDVENINAHSIDTLKMWFENSGGWPVVNGNLWDEEYFNMKNALDIICEHSIITSDSIFFEMRVDRDPKNDEKKILFMYQPVGRGRFITDLLGKGFYGPAVQDYYEYMIEVAAFFGAPKIRAAKEMRDVIDFEIELAKIISETVLNDDSVPKTVRMTLHELQKTYGFIDWLTHLNKMIYPAKKKRYNDEVIVTNPRYFKQLDQLLQDTPKKTQANYMYWAIVHYLSPYLHEDLRNMANVLKSKIYNTTLNKSRWTFCINSGLVLARKALYSRNYLNDSLDAAKEIVQGIKSQFLTLMEETEWMDSAGKEKALEIAKTADVVIDCPDEFQDDEVLEEYYKDLDIDPEDYLDSMLKISIFNKQQKYSELDESLNDNDWRKTASFFRWDYYTAVHDTSEGLGTLPTTAFQGIFFNTNRPNYMNYGSIGFVIAYTLTYSLERPEMKDDMLVWQPEIKTAFKEKTECIQDQNGDSSYDDKAIYELVSSVVSIAAVEEAYLAYKNWTETNGEEEALPGLESHNTPGQLFWISLGNSFCRVTNSDASKWKSVLHEDNRNFINVLAMNSEYFSKDFKCPKNSTMNPIKKCSVW